MAFASLTGLSASLAAALRSPAAAAAASLAAFGRHLASPGREPAAPFHVKRRQAPALPMLGEERATRVFAHSLQGRGCGGSSFPVGWSRPKASIQFARSM